MCEITDLVDYVKEITSININSLNDKFYNNNILLFRGQSDCNYKLLPAIGRNRHCAADTSILNEERNLIEMAKFKMPDIFRNDLTPVELLALLQHYGIPTRLLDITENSLVALYFACCSKPDKDGEVFVFKHDERYVATYPVINGIAESYKFSFCTINSIEAFYDDIKNQSYFLEQKNTNEICNKTSKDGANWIVECCKNPFFIYAPIRSDRQKAQAGRYILFHNRISSRTNELYFENVIDPIDKNDEILKESIRF